MPLKLYTLRHPLTPHPNSLNPPRPKDDQHSANRVKIGHSPTTVDGAARGVLVPVRWTPQQGYFLGRRTTPGSEPPRHAINAARARQRSVFFLSLPLSRLVPPRSYTDRRFHTVFRRPSMPAVPRAWAGMQIRRRAPHARTQQAEAFTHPTRRVAAASSHGGTEDPQTRLHLALCPTPGNAYVGTTDQRPPTPTSGTGHRRCRITGIVRIVRK